MSVASLGFGAISARMQYKTTKAEEDSQDAFNRGLLDDAVRGYRELDKAEEDIIYESHANSLETQKQALTARSDILLHAAGTGAYGGSVDSALTDLGRGFSSRMSEITVNRDRHLDNVVSQAEDIQAGVRRSADRTIIQPAWFSAGMAGLRTTSQVMNIEQGIAKAGAGG